jgi:hypothetical protein
MTTNPSGTTTTAPSATTTATSARPVTCLASTVMFVHDLAASVSFYRELLTMQVTVENDTAALLTNAAGYQLYLRSMGPHAQHTLGGVGVQYVIWTAPSQEDLVRCERFLKGADAHLRTRAADGFTLIEGRDPSNLPVVMTYPGPDQVARHEIISRIYEW